ncbi:MAG: translation initiation factor IF-2 subunit alpha [Candidatus Micrarchaeota archaeon]|nr:translation initiation factor IF-2 subunit alpha [Candidatus Micrarchaeota archaeon]
MERRMPEIDELVFARVKKILPYGAFCSLEEYGDIEAFIHVSEVAPRWIKNIREFLKEGQRVVARVYRFLPEKNQIDLSLKRVSESEKRRKLDDMRRDKRAGKILEMVAGKVGEKPEEFTRRISDAILSKFEDIYAGLEELSENPSAFDGLKIGDDALAAIRELAQVRITKPKAKLSKVIVLSCPEKEGIDVIKNALLGVKASEGTEMEISYLGAPRYQINVVAEDYKAANKLMDGVAKELAEAVRAHGGSGNLEGAE